MSGVDERRGDRVSGVFGTFIRGAIAAMMALSLMTVSGQASVVTSSSQEEVPPSRTSPPGQIGIVTVNAKQHRILDVARFERLYALVLSLRRRPLAFDGGSTGASVAPDVLALQEISASNLEIAERLMRQNFPYRYSIVGSSEAAAKFIVNQDRVELVGTPVLLNDVCTSSATPTDGAEKREFQLARFIDKATGSHFAVLALELARTYPRPDCREENIRELVRVLEAETGPVIIAGDFNQRAMKEMLECDPGEHSEPLAWWQLLTGPRAAAEGAESGGGFYDAVRSVRFPGADLLSDEWTHEWRKSIADCTGQTQPKRSRIDYIFARDAVLGAAGADDPGWAGERPGTRNPEVPRYSDHRFVWGRLVISGPPPPPAPLLQPVVGGGIQMTWEPVPEAIRYVVLRAKGRQPYAVRALVESSTTGFLDLQTSHGVAYRYAVAAIGPDGGQGLESFRAWMRADAKGPEVTVVTPRDGATGVNRRTELVVRFNERIDPASITGDRIVLRRGRAEVGGAIRSIDGRTIGFDPYYPLRRQTWYKVTVKPMRDEVGNRGTGHWWSFLTGGRRPR